MTTSEFSLTSSQTEMDITLTAVDDNVLEDLEEMFSVSIALDNPDILASAVSTSVEMTVRDNDS